MSRRSTALKDIKAIKNSQQRRRPIESRRERAEKPGQKTGFETFWHALKEMTSILHNFYNFLQ